MALKSNQRVRKKPAVRLIEGVVDLSGKGLQQSRLQPRRCRLSFLLQKPVALPEKSSLGVPADAFTCLIATTIFALEESGRPAVRL